MKPTPQFNQPVGRDGAPTCSARRASHALLTDYDFHAGSVDFKGHCGPSCLAAFRQISGNYFENEAPKTFVGEAALFAIIVMTAAVPLVSNVHALLQLVRSSGVA